MLYHLFNFIIYNVIRLKIVYHPKHDSNFQNQKIKKKKSLYLCMLVNLKNQMKNNRKF